MRTLRRYLATEIVAATALVFAALVLLFAFFDLVEQIKDLGRGAYTLRRIVLYVLLSVPDHVYELFPIAALIGTLFALAQLVASTEYTVIRTSNHLPDMIPLSISMSKMSASTVRSDPKSRVESHM